LLTTPLTVTVGALARMLHTQRLGRPHHVLYAEPVWTDDDHTADTAMWAEFGQVDGDLLDTLSVLARPTTEYFAWFTEHGQQYGVLVAQAAGESVLAHRDGDNITIHTLDRTESPPMALIRQLPDAQPAPIDAVNIRLDSGQRTHDTAKLAALAQQQPTGQGELYAGARDYQGHYVVNNTHPIRYQDYATGRVLVVLTDDYLSLAPATKRVLLNSLTEVARRWGPDGWLP
jgi:hypothetical protein